jgi:hypothetical protein
VEKIYLERRQEEETARAESATSEDARKSHEALAQQYGERLAALASNSEPARP